MISALQVMGAIEAKNGLPCRTIVKCLRGCGVTRDLTEEAVSTFAQQPQPESATCSVPHRSCKGCPEYGLDRDCSGKCP